MDVDTGGGIDSKWRGAGSSESDVGGGGKQCRQLAERQQVVPLLTTPTASIGGASTTLAASKEGLEGVASSVGSEWH